MGHDHAHGIPENVTLTGKHASKLGWALALTLTYMLAEVVGGLTTGSLALLADAAHMFTDAAGLGMALLAIRFAARPATPQKTFGYLRAEVLAALANAVVLLGVTGFILYEAYERFINPPEIISGPMLAVAAVGLIVNLISMKLLASGSGESLNVRGAYFEVLSDMLGSIGVILAAVIIMVTGWKPIDPIIGAGIGLFIVPRTWKLLNEAVHILLEGAPTDIDYIAVQAALEKIGGVHTVHDLHIWTITSGINSLSVHIEVEDPARAEAVLRKARTMLKEKFRIEHVTIQIEVGDDCNVNEGTVPHVQRLQEDIKASFGNSDGDREAIIKKRVEDATRLTAEAEEMIQILRAKVEVVGRDSPPVVELDGLVESLEYVAAELREQLGRVRRPP
jgi:cobalt-zinc-cadmium efflux system protein